MKDLTPLLHPASIAIVGCSPVSSGKLGSWPLRNLLLQQAPATLYPVNPGHTEIDGLTCYPDLSSLPAPPDLVLVMVPAARSVEVLREAERIGARAAIVFSAGFGETAGGGDVDAELRAFCADTAMPVCGPNTDGVINVIDRIPSGFPPYAAIEDLPVGPVAVISQSGALVSSLVMRLLRNGLGMTYSCAIGNGVDLGIGDFLGHLATDERVGTILIYLEGLTDRAAFLDGADRAIAAGKSVAVLKGGRSAEGAAAAASHTGAMVGSHAAFRALCDAHGIVIADDLAELAAIPLLQPLARRTVRSVGVLSGSGAVGGLITDKARQHGFDVPPLAAATVKRLSARMHYGEPRNPIDLTGQVVHDPPMHVEVLEALADDPGLDVLVASSLYGPAEITDRMKHELVAAAGDGARILVYATDGNDPADEPILRSAGVPVLPSLDVLFGCLRSLGVRPGPSAPGSPSPEVRAAARALVAPLPAGPLPAEVAWELLELYGIATAAERPVARAEDAVKIADELGGPVALKLTGPTLAHKSDRGLVRLDLSGADAVRAAHEALATVRDRDEPTAEVVVQPMVPGGVEMIVGGTVDAESGPMVMVGAGGILAEVLADTEVAPAPIGPGGATELVERTRAGRLLAGPRGRAPADHAALADTVAGVSHLVADLSDLLGEIDINPVIVLENGAIAVDVFALRTV